MQDCKFYIRSTNIDFVEKQRNILNLINAFDKEKDEKQKDEPGRSAEPMEVDNSCERVSLKRKRSETKHFRGKESIFKKPIDLPPRFRVRDIPDHQRNPHKWVKYTLGDVSPDDMTNQSNTAAALTFLRELEERKQKETPEDNKEEIRRIIFKPSQLVKKSSEPHVEETSNASRTESLKTSVFRSSKLVMPEYVVGMEKKTRAKKIRRENSQCTIRKEVSLKHLYDNEDDE